MSIKKLTLKLKSGLLSDLHSDTVMGHFCWRLKDRLGEEKLKEFISLYTKDEPIFTISSAILQKDGELFFPKPLINIKSENQNQNQISKKEKILKFQINKELKSKELLTLNQFNLFLNGKIDELYNDLISSEIEYPKFESDLRLSVEIDRAKMSSREGQLFSYYPKFLNEKSRVIFLLKIFNEENFEMFKCEQVLKDIFEVGFGKKKSSGYGQFEVELKDGKTLEDFNSFEEPSKANGFVTLSNYIPSANDSISKSNYDFIVKYGRLGEEKSLSKNPFKKPLIMFTPGSVFKTEKIKEYYGKVTKGGDVSEFDLEAVQFGMPFTLNFSIV